MNETTLHPQQEIITQDVEPKRDQDVGSTEVIKRLFGGSGREVTLLNDDAPDETSLTPNEQGEQAPIAGEAVASPEELAIKINEISNNPRAFSQEEVARVLSDVLRGRTPEQFFAEESQANPELAEALHVLVEKVKTDISRQQENVINISNLLELPAATTSEEATVDQLENLQQMGEELNADILEDDGTKNQVSIKKLAAVVALVAIDMALFKGELSTLVVSLTHNTTQLLRVAGVDMPAMGISSERAYEEMVGFMSPRNLNEFLQSRTGDEMHRFLSHLDKDTVVNMLSKKRFGGVFQNKQEPLADNQISMIYSKLSRNELSDLDKKFGINQFNPNTNQS